MTLDEFFLRLESDNRLRRGRHKLRKPLTDAELAKWRKGGKRPPLPDDYLSLLRRANGVKLDVVSGFNSEGKENILPLKEVGPAGSLLNGGDDSQDGDYPAAWLGVAANGNGDHFVILDTAADKYLEIDPIDPENPTLEMRGLSPFLEWLVANGIYER